VLLQRLWRGFRDELIYLGPVVEVVADGVIDGGGAHVRVSSDDLLRRSAAVQESSYRSNANAEAIDNRLAT
jgi:hypothetical protein